MPFKSLRRHHRGFLRRHAHKAKALAVPREAVHDDVAVQHLAGRNSPRDGGVMPGRGDAGVMPMQGDDGVVTGRCDDGVMTGRGDAGVMPMQGDDGVMPGRSGDGVMTGRGEDGVMTGQGDDRVCADIKRDHDRGVCRDHMGVTTS